MASMPTMTHVSALKRLIEITGTMPNFGECVVGIGVPGGDWATDERIAQAAIGAKWQL
jgi:uncharacterized protein GlcG (DUF336 family)